jgi:cyclophilin family peptidyl-prolyl cis-trans isomerase
LPPIRIRDVFNLFLNGKIAAVVIVSALGAAVLSGCEGEPMTSPLTEKSVETETETAFDAEILNFIPPQPGEKIAVITVRDFGEIKIKLFPEAAPLGVENFIGLAEMGYYDELIFHRVIEGFMNQGGDPRGDGTGGKSIWGDKFDGGIPEGLYHFSGAVAYANSGSTSTNGSQFYIVNTPEGYVYGGVNPSAPGNVNEKYAEVGGTPSLDGGYTVFGQVFDGMDAVRLISLVETDENDKPLKQVLIEKIEIVEYEE